MTKNDFIDAMGNIDLDIIEHADKAPVRKSKTFMKLAAVAAALALIVAGAFAVAPMLRNGPAVSTGDKVVWENIFSWKGNESGISESSSLESKTFYEILNKEYSAYEKGRVIDRSFIGEKLADTEIRTWVYNFILEKETESEISKAEIFAISGIAPDAAVAVKYIDGETPVNDSAEYCYIALNREYKASSFAEFIADHNAEDSCMLERFTFLFKSGRTFTDFTDWETKYITDEDRALLTDILTSLDAQAEMSGMYQPIDERLDGCGEYLRCCLTLNCAGASKYTVVYVLENGYIAMQMGKTDLAFFNVGRDVTDEFFSATERYSENNAGGDRVISEETTSMNAN